MNNNNHLSDENTIGHVIRILDERTLIIDVGVSSISEGTKIQVYEPGPEIFDLDGNSLSTFSFIKDTLEVVETTSLYSVCKKKDTKVIKPASVFSLSPLLSQETAYIPMNVNPEEIEPLKAKDLTIHVGDPIKYYD